ncbi:MAG: MFS transporter [Acidobacteriota bacterium]|nr:MFS transporter [Acidobacteriota bacterium]
MSRDPFLGSGKGRSFRTFLLIAIGQVVSLFGSHLTAFALGVWVFQRNGSATEFALISFFAVVPGIVLAPVSGVLADRWDRRWVMVLSDLGAGVGTIVLAVLAARGNLEVWHIYPLVALSATFASLQGPAFAAATPQLVPRKHLSRANGLVEMGSAGALLAAPLAAGALIADLGLAGIMLIDIATFVFAVSCLLFVRIPRPPASEEGSKDRGSILREAWTGWTYVSARRGMLGLLLLFTLANFSFGMVQALLTPLVLTFGTAEELGRVLAVATGGMVLGGVLMSVWGGPRRIIRAILLCFLVQGLILLLGGARPNLVLIAGAASVFTFCEPIILASSRTLWQRKVPLDLQGRVFAVRQLIAWSAMPLAFLLAGPLADFVFEPLMAADGALAPSLGALIGVGPGRGIGLLFVLIGGLILGGLALAARYRPLVRFEEEIPDALPDSDSAPDPEGASEFSQHSPRDAAG